MSDYRKRDNYKRLESEEPLKGKVYFDQVLERFHIDLKDPVNQIVIHWEALVGPDFASYAKCTGIKDKVIYVSCDHPSKAAFVRMQSREVLKKIKGVYPELGLQKLVVRVRQVTTT